MSIVRAFGQSIVFITLKKLFDKLSYCKRFLSLHGEQNNFVLTNYQLNYELNLIIVGNLKFLKLAKLPLSFASRAIICLKTDQISAGQLAVLNSSST